MKNAETTALDTGGHDTHLQIWIVEDDDDYRETIASVLNRVSGMRCSHQFASAEAALDHFHDTPAAPSPQVILMDQNLPGLNGTDCTGRIKADFPDIAILMLNYPGRCRYHLRGTSRRRVRLSPEERSDRQDHHCRAGGR